MYSTRTAAVTVTYADTLTEGVGERVAVHVQYTQCHSYCDLSGYSDRGAMYSVCGLCHMICHMMYVCKGDPCTWTVHVHPLCQSYYGCSNGTVTKHGSTGHPSVLRIKCTCIGPLEREKNPPLVDHRMGLIYISGITRGVLWGLEHPFVGRTNTTIDGIDQQQDRMHARSVL